MKIDANPNTNSDPSFLKGFGMKVTMACASGLSDNYPGEPAPGREKSNRRCADLDLRSRCTETRGRSRILPAPGSRACRPDARWSAWRSAILALAARGESHRPHELRSDRWSPDWAERVRASARRCQDALPPASRANRRAERGWCSCPSQGALWRGRRL